MRPRVRSASLHGYPDLARSFGLDPAALLARVGLEPIDLADPDAWIPSVAVARLLEMSAAESGREDFGLRLAQLRRLSTVGPLSVVLREEPDLRSALLLLIRYEHSYNEAIRVALIEAGGMATVRGRLVLGEPVPIRQVVEHNLAALVGVVRMLLGPGWEPRSVCFQHAPPADLDLHRLLLGPRLLFEQEFTGLVFSATELAAANLMADPDDTMLWSYASRVLDSLPPPPDSDLVNRVREAIQVLLPLRRASMMRVARGLGVTKRTLHRQLAERDETFSRILEETRRSLAECYLAGDRFTVSDISDLLGFAASSGFARWFRRSSGTSPTAWRLAAAGLAPAPLGA